MQPRQVRRMRHCGENPRGLFPPTLQLFMVLVCAWLTPAAVRAAETEEGVALAIVYDTSGSMRQAVATADGKRAAKYIIGNRALEVLLRNRLEREKPLGAGARTRRVYCLGSLRNQVGLGLRNIGLCHAGRGALHRDEYRTARNAIARANFDGSDATLSGRAQASGTILVGNDLSGNDRRSG